MALGAMSIAAETESARSTSSGSSHVSQKKRDPGHPNSPLEAGSVSNNLYRNPSLGFSCKIPAGWVLRTDEMNARKKDEPEAEGNPAPKDESGPSASSKSPAALDRTAESGCPQTGSCGRVLLAAFSRPPEATGEDVNSSILIAAESVEAYPGLKEAAQYFGPVSEVAKARGFQAAEEPYEFQVGSKTLVRGDFQKDVGTRVMQQSTLVMLAHGYALSFTFIGGTEDEVDQLIEGLNFQVSSRDSRPPK